MTVPAVWNGSYIIVALVTKVSLRRVTVQAGISQTLDIFFAVGGGINPGVMANDFFSPVQQQVHVVGPHPLGWLHTLFFISWEIEFRGIIDVPAGGTGPDREAY